MTDAGRRGSDPSFDDDAFDHDGPARPQRARTGRTVIVDESFDESFGDDFDPRPLSDADRRGRGGDRDAPLGELVADDLENKLFENDEDDPNDRSLQRGFSSQEPSLPRSAAYNIAPAQQEGYGSIWRYAIVASVIWLGAAVAFSMGLFLVPTSSVGAALEGLLSLNSGAYAFMMGLGLGPLALIWMAAVVARQAKALRIEASFLQNVADRLAERLERRPVAEEAPANVAFTSGRDAEALKREADDAVEALQRLEENFIGAEQRARDARERLEAESSALSQLFVNGAAHDRPNGAARVDRDAQVAEFASLLAKALADSGALTPPPAPRRADAAPAERSFGEPSFSDQSFADPSYAEPSFAEPRALDPRAPIDPTPADPPVRPPRPQSPPQDHFTAHDASAVDRRPPPAAAASQTARELAQGFEEARAAVLRAADAAATGRTEPTNGAADRRYDDQRYDQARDVGRGSDEDADRRIGELRRQLSENSSVSAAAASNEPELRARETPPRDAFAADFGADDHVAPHSEPNGAFHEPEPAPAPAPRAAAPIDPHPVDTPEPPISPDPEPAPRAEIVDDRRPSVEDSDSPAFELDWPKFVRAANFPDSEDDRETLDALYAVLTDRDAAGLLQSAEDALSGLADIGLFMEDMRPHHAPVDVWRRYVVEGDSRDAMELGGVRDATAIEDVITALSDKPDFEMTVDRFLKRYEEMLARLFNEGQEPELVVRLADTRSGRAYMLLGRSSGRFG